jgi:hypothetical protein
VLICLGLIALGYAVAIGNVIINVKYGQRMSVDQDGWWLQGGLLFASSLAPALIISLAAADGKVSLRLYGMALLLGGLSFWNTSDFIGEQFVGKTKIVELKATSAQDRAEIENEHRLQERKETREMFGRAYLNAKTKEAKEQAKTDLEGVLDKPIALSGTSVEVALAAARAAISQTVFGYDKDRLKSLAITLAAAIMELWLPALGIRKWPAEKIPAAQRLRASVYEVGAFLAS